MLITLKGISKSFGSEEVLHDIDLNITNGSRIGLIGLNGSGKSTLLKIISGELSADSGSVYISSMTSIGYLSQNLHLDEELSIYDETLKVFSDVMKLEEDLEEKRRMMEETSDPALLEKLTAEFTSMSETFEEKRGYYYRGIVTGTLRGLGFSEGDLGMKIALLSGGQKMRVALAKMLIQSPDLLLLDEHTAALDPKTAAKVLEISDKIVADNHLTTMMVTHNMKDALAYGNRLIMFHEGKIVIDVRGEDKKKLSAADLLEYFEG